MTEIDERTAQVGRTDSAATAEVINLFPGDNDNKAKKPTPVDMTKAAPRSTPSGSAPAAEPVTGTVITADEWELGEDPEGDRPWVHPSLKTSEGRKARASYSYRAARRRSRRWVARQATPRGVVQATLRGGVRVHRWTRGVEARNADAARERAELMARESARATRQARFALTGRDKKKTHALVAQQELQTAVIQASAARQSATKKFFQRAAASYAPLAGIDAAGYVFMDGALGLAGGVLVNLAVLARVGRRPEMDPEDLEAMEREDAGMPEQFEIGMTVRGFEAMLREALNEDLKVAVYAMRIEAEVWGFKVHLTLHRQTPKKLSESLDDLEACLPGVRTSSVLLQQSAQARNECVLRIPGKDQWKAVPELPYRAPHSVPTEQIHTAQIGSDMSGQALALPMCRTNVNVVGGSRSGKSTLLRSILDALTATEDQIVIGIDLGSAGSGFGEYRRAMHAVATTPEQARMALDWALDVGKGRPGLFDRLDMGENWVTSRKRPGIKIVVDEFPALVRQSAKGYINAEGKRTSWDLDGSLGELVVTSAKGDVTVVIAGQGVTKEKVQGNTWLTELPVQVMCSCDTDDVVQILGGGAMAQGWRPDRLLPAMPPHVNDASVAYVFAGADYCEPIPYRACITTREESRSRATERAEAGLVVLDAESEALSTITVKELQEICAEDAPPAPAQDAKPQLLVTIREIYTDAGDPSGMTEDELFDALADRDAETWDQEQFTDEDGEQMPKGEVLALVLGKVLGPRHLRWSKEKYRPKGGSGTVRGYRLKDLRALLGETAES